MFWGLYKGKKLIASSVGRYKEILWQIAVEDAYYEGLKDDDPISINNLKKLGYRTSKVKIIEE